MPTTHSHYVFTRVKTAAAALHPSGDVSGVAFNIWRPALLSTKDSFEILILGRYDVDGALQLLFPNLLTAMCCRVRGRRPQDMAFYTCKFEDARHSPSPSYRGRRQLLTCMLLAQSARG